MVRHSGYQCAAVMCMRSRRQLLVLVVATVYADRPSCKW
jgi:hypothetical protein